MLAILEVQVRQTVGIHLEGVSQLVGWLIETAASTRAGVMRIVQAHTGITVVVGTDGELYFEDTFFTILGQGIEVVI